MSPFEKAAAQRSGTKPCNFCADVAELPAKRRRELEAALENRRFSAAVIASVLDEWGVHVSDGTVQKHRSFVTRKCRTKFPEGK